MLLIKDDGKLEHTECGGEYTQVWDAIDRETKGFYCLKCKDFEPAKENEKQLPLGGLNGKYSNKALD